MEGLNSYIDKVRIPSNDIVYKEECIFSFDNPETDSGIYVCLRSFLGIGKRFVEEFSRKTGNNIFLHIHRIKKEIQPEKELEPDKKIARLAIGVEGGFSTDVSKNYHIEEHYKIVTLPGFIEFPYPDEDLPSVIKESVSGILKAENALQLVEAAATAEAWDGEIRPVSKHADNLPQINDGLKVPSSGWSCSECDKSDNLWMNLTDGKILCGRRQLDGSGGNNHAVEHYEKTGYPLAVKLGTITADGKADVYSYTEDEMVLNPNLTQHLLTFGINVSRMEKTEKTMAELEIDYNQRAWEWSRLTEADAALVPKYGPGFTGLRNLGNSCYLNSVVQILMTVPSFQSKFFDNGDSLRRSVLGQGVSGRQEPSLAPSDFNVQMSKLADGLLSGRYSERPHTSDQQCGLAPIMFRSLVGKGHPEFSTKRQQDAMEFLEHVLKLVSRNSAQGSDPGHSFKFKVEDKFICGESGKVRYVNRNDLYLPLPVPLDEATNKQQVADFLAKKEQESKCGDQSLRKKDEQMHYKIPFASCLSRLESSEEIRAFSSAVSRETLMRKVTRLATFPDYLFIQLVKFGLTPDWQPIKYDVAIDMPDMLDLSSLKGFGLQPGEEEMPDSNPCPNDPSKVQIDESVVQQLSEMGFPPEACRKAVHLTNNSGSEAAMNWIMEHMEDHDFAAPLATSTGKTEGDFCPSEEALAMLMSMGFTQPQARLALKETSNDVERAADWLFSRQPQLDSLVAAEEGRSEAPSSEAPGGALPPFTDGDPRYELVAFISHMGTSIFVGHYVCHIKKDGEWILFNDEKVCASESPPKEFGYIYLYRRISS